MDAFKAGGGNAALQKLLKQRAGSARFFINANHPLNVKPEKGYTPEQIASARRVIEARGRKALAQQTQKNWEKVKEVTIPIQVIKFLKKVN